jgi:hypothetical protein
MPNRLPRCPVCNGELTVTGLHCPSCDINIEGRFNAIHNPFAQLTPEQMEFVVTFVRCEGKFNRMEEEMKLSYPTLRSRFNDILRAMGYEPGREESSKLSLEERRAILEELDKGKITWAEAQIRLSGKKDETVEAPAEKGGA